jgi:hypothetical protein
MILEWFDASEAAKIGVELADQFAPQQVTRAAMHGNQTAPSNQDDELHAILQRADRRDKKCHSVTLCARSGAGRRRFYVKSHPPAFNKDT